MFVLKACRRCNGDLIRDLSDGFNCMQCGHELRPDERTDLLARLRSNRRSPTKLLTPPPDRTTVRQRKGYYCRGCGVKVPWRKLYCSRGASQYDKGDYNVLVDSRPLQ